ncbi:MAG: tRNA lysidine(34) synthetase TilS [Candidatus Obscuribacter sp.]|nr:tRNA lysidine(34) synthetase TilS [Candidatus Obscuribacter sp.]
MDQNQLSLPLFATLAQDYFNCLASAGWSVESNDANATRMLPPCLVALSGGADSVFLLSVLSKIYTMANQAERLAVCHVNHNVRQAAFADAAFCGSLARSLGHRYEERCLTGQSRDEAQMREERYQSLKAVCEQLAIPYIVTAHHLDDQVETFIFRLVRGMSAAGTSGIKAVLPLGSVTLLRPFLHLRHSFIVESLSAAAIAFVEDESNSDTSYARNYLRAEILPGLSARFNQAFNNIEHFRALVDLDQSFIAEHVQKLSESVIDTSGALDLSCFEQLHQSLQGRLLVAWLKRAGVAADYILVERLQRMLKGKLGAQSVKSDLQAIVQGGKLILQNAHSSASSDLERLLAAAKPVSIAVPKSGRRTVLVPWLGCALLLPRLEPGTQYEAPRNKFIEYVELDSLDQFELRLREPGDLFAHSGGGEPGGRLKKHLHRLGGAKAPQLTAIAGLYQGGLLGTLAPSQLLRYLPLLASGKEVLWLPGLGISGRVEVRGEANLRLELIPLSQHPDIDGALSEVTC